ncbi:eCIS core domain-containing protein [Flavitalea sp.]|nr:DUF4157 domain-containing protein [Flavitalea sp.]
MSYATRVYRQRNAHTHDETTDQAPFFTRSEKQADRSKSSQPFFQPKLEVGAPNDKYEKEADAVAGAVVNNQNKSAATVQQKKISSIQRLATPEDEEKLSTNEDRMKEDKKVQQKPEIQAKCDECEKEEKDKAVQKMDDPEKEKDKMARGPVQKMGDPEMEKEDDKKSGVNPVQKKSDGSKPASSQLSSRIEQSAGKGKGMGTKTRDAMESSFGHNFSDVNIHTGAESMEMNRELGAQAFTHGKDIYFNSGKYNPDTSSGKQLLAHELTHVVQQNGATEAPIERKISVQDPHQNIPNPDGKGLKQSNEVTVLEYLGKLCPDTGIMVGDGQVDLLDTGFCFPSEQQEDGSFKSPAELSDHPVSCECLCEMIMDPLDLITIHIDDNVAGTGSTGSAGGITVISVPSPNAKEQPVRGTTGESVESPPHIILAHEMCGHHFLAKHGVDERENVANMARGGHDSAIGRENLIREEHDIKTRGTFRDPCCGLGESTAEDLAKPSGKCGKEFEEAKKTHRGFAFECQHWRQEYNKLNGTNFTTDDAIPEAEDESLPAKWRFEITFKIDTPQPWLTLQQSLTEEGKESLQIVTLLLNRHPDLNAQLAGNASTDNASGDPDYNNELAKRRAEFVFKDLVEKGTSEERFTTFDSDCEELRDGVHNCGDTESEKKSNALDRNVEVKMFD